MVKKLDKVEYEKRRLCKQFYLDLIPGYDPFKDSSDYYFDEKAAIKVIEFFRCYLTHVKGGKSEKAFDLEPWQIAILANTFGWKHKETHWRRYREVFIFVPRKNGKTTLAAGIGLYLLYCDKEPGAEIYCAAADRDQATLVFDQAKQMIMNCQALANRGKIYTKSIVLKGTNSFFKVISADAHTKHGFNTHGAIIDELHAQPNRELVDVVTTSTGSRDQSLVVFITTSDFDRPSICNEKLDYAGKVRDGIIPVPDFLPVIYETKSDADWKSEKVWKESNPNYGVSVKPEYLKKKCIEAQETPSFENTFKRLHLNMKTATDTKWLSMDKWDSYGTLFTEEELHRMPCFGGLDLATTTDIAAFTLFFPENKNKVLSYLFVPEETAALRDRKTRIPYLKWAKEKHLILTPGNVIDYDYIRKVVNEKGKVFNIKEIGFDRWNSSQLITQLRGDGFLMEEFGQGYQSMSAPAKELEKLVTSQNLDHGKHPVMRWMASNACIDRDATDNIKPAKNKSAEKIDGIVALCMSIGRSMLSGPVSSVYETHGIRILE